MIALFFSCVCDFCDGVLDDSEHDTGFIVWHGRATPAQHYVFPSLDHAERWRTMNGLGDAPIREVRAPVRFTWRVSTGTLKDLVTADKLVTIYPNHRFAPEPHRAYLT
jgi:hypothetical protein